MIIRLFARLIALLLLLSLNGCISVAEMKKPVPSGAAVAVLTPGKPEQFVFSNYADAKGFIPLYGFAKMIEAESAESFLNKELSTQGFNIERALQLALVQDLRSRNVEATPVSIERPAESLPSALKNSDLPDANGAWAMLDARITGYGLNAQMTGEFRPFVSVIVRRSFRKGI